MSGLTFGVDYDQVSYWDPVANEWKHYVADVDFNDFDTFEYGKSYEINVIKTGGVNFTVSGNCPGAIPYNIVLGSNFVTPAIKTTQLVSTVLADLTPSDYSDVKKLDPVTQTLKSYSVGDFSSFEPGVGYIIEGLQNAVFNYSETTKVTDYVYDSSGARVKKIVNGASPTIYLGKDFVKESTGTTTKYIFLGDMRVASKDSTGKQEFIHSDHISSSNIITNELGILQVKLEYWPYGVSATDTSDTRYKFTGQEEDDEANLYYYGARYYDPEIGRFVSADPTVPYPLDPQAFNRYAYARNNPLIYIDPTGYEFEFSNYIEIRGDRPGDYSYSGFDSGGQSYYNQLSGTNFSTPTYSGFDFGFSGYSFKIDSGTASSFFQNDFKNYRLSPAAELGLGTLSDPVDIAFTFRDWSQGDYQHSDWLAFLPVISHASVRLATKGIGDGQFASRLFRHSDDMARNAFHGANFAQKTFSESFSSKGPFKGVSIDDLANALRKGEISAADVPIDYIARDGSNLILNTRSAEALKRAGIPRSKWLPVDRTGQKGFEKRLNRQLRKNGLDSKGFANPQSNG